MLGSYGKKFCYPLIFLSIDFSTEIYFFANVCFDLVCGKVKRTAIWDVVFL